MAGQLLPPAEIAPSVDPNATPQQCVRIWLDLLRSGSKLLMAGLRREVGPHGDVNEAYRKWYSEQMDEHDQKIVGMLQRMNRVRDSDGG